MARKRSSIANKSLNRSMNTSAYPSQRSYAQPVSRTQTDLSSRPGLFGQMASTAAGVAVGSTIGHTLGAGITSLFGGSSSSRAEPYYQQEVQTQHSDVSKKQLRSCEGDSRSFVKCLEDNVGNTQNCDYYLQQLKACQEAASMY